MTRVAVTGVTGFVGPHLVRELAAHGIGVVGVSDHAGPSADLPLEEYVEADLTRRWPTLPTVDAVVHLAGLSAVGRSFGEPLRYVETSAAMLTHLGEHCLASTSRPRVLVVSSGAVYAPGQVLPLGEDAQLGLTSPYAVSKVLGENLASYYRSRGLDFVVVRPFNHVGPGQGPGFLLPDLAAAVRQAQVSGTPLRVGDLSTRRDYTDVRDVAAAYRLLAAAPELRAQVYNVCSGRSRSGEEVLAAVRAATGAGDLAVEVDPDRLRPNDDPEVVGDATRLCRDTGWAPAVPWEQTVADAVATG